VKVPGTKAIGFTVGFPNQPSIRPVSSPGAGDIRQALDQASALAQRGAGSRVWVVRPHIRPDELQRGTRRCPTTP
jgi:hypothetical protein